MHYSGQSGTLRANRAIFLVATFAFSVLTQFFTISLQPALAAGIDGATIAAVDQASVGGDFSTQYTSLTKKILMAGVDLERFSLHYRLETARRPKLRQLRYFLGQEAGAGCGLLLSCLAVSSCP